MSSLNGNSYDEQNINIINNRFSALQIQNESKKTICKFFLKNSCDKGNNCKYSHNIRDNMTKPKDEVTDAVDNGNLNSIFEKMLSNEEDYKKYYKKLYMRFRGYAVMNLDNKYKSIVKDIIDRISLRDVTINGEKLKYGYMPILFHFIMTGFAWNTFQGAGSDTDYQQLIKCFSDVIEQLQKTKVKHYQIPKYNDEEYDEMVIEACQYKCPDTYDNAIHVAAHYLCDNVIQHIKDTFKSNRIRKLGEDATQKLRESMTENEFNNFINKDYNEMLNETNITNQKAEDLFKERKTNRQDAINKYTEKYEKAKLRAGSNKALITDATNRYEYNIKNFDKKIEMFNNQVFKVIERKRIIIKDINYDELFNTSLPKLHGFTNRYGIRIDITILSNLLNLINNNLKHKKDENMKLIINSLKNMIMNPKDVIQTFKDMKCLDYLWSAILNSINEDTPVTFSVDLLNVFFSEEQLGLRESYIYQYLEKLSNLSETMSNEEKTVFVGKILSSMIQNNVKSLINL